MSTREERQQGGMLKSWPDLYALPFKDRSGNTNNEGTRHIIKINVSTMFKEMKRKQNKIWEKMGKKF